MTTREYDCESFGCEPYQGNNECRHCGAEMQPEPEPAKTAVSKHTPGPWRAMPYRKVNGADGVEVCALQSRKIEVADANAHLIAAAPDMLEALENLVEQIDDVALTAKATAAIKKARGQS